MTPYSKLLSGRRAFPRMFRCYWRANSRFAKRLSTAELLPWVLEAARVPEDAISFFLRDIFTARLQLLGTRLKLWCSIRYRNLGSCVWCVLHMIVPVGILGPGTPPCDYAWCAVKTLACKYTKIDLLHTHSCVCWRTYLEKYSHLSTATLGKKDWISMAILLIGKVWKGTIFPEF